MPVVFASVFGLFSLLLTGLFLAGFIYLMVWVIRALKKYVQSQDPRKEETAHVRKSLGETLRDHRSRCSMTQEFVAESLGVSRQAVSKWESGTSEPSTSNLLALARLYGVSAEALLQNVQQPKKTC